MQAPARGLAVGHMSPRYVVKDLGLFNWVVDLEESRPGDLPNFDDD